MRSFFRMLVILAVAGGCLCASLAADKRPYYGACKRERVYDGRWWFSADPEEQSGFLNGAADCLTWVVHAKWLSHSVESLGKKITEYYKAHPASKAMPVVEVWQKVVSVTRPAEPTKGGERWTNPHGYYDGLYWRQGSESEQTGFLEGYLSCMRARVESPAEIYSRPISYYVRRIDDYIKTHPKADDEAIADILSRFRDKPSRK